MVFKTTLYRTGSGCAALPSPASRAGTRLARRTKGRASGAGALSEVLIRPRTRPHPPLRPKEDADPQSLPCSLPVTPLCSLDGVG